MVNNCGQFTPLRFVFTGEENSDEWTCYAVATELSTGELLKGPKISFLTAKKEGWYSKQGSK